MARNNGPAATFRIGYVKATVWQNDNFYNVSVTRTYKDDNGDYKDGDSLGHADLLNAAECLRKAEQYISAQ